RSNRASPPRHPRAGPRPEWSLRRPELRCASNLPSCQVLLEPGLLPDVLGGCPLMRRQRHEVAIAPAMTPFETFLLQALTALAFDLARQGTFPIRSPPLRLEQSLIETGIA